MTTPQPREADAATASPLILSERVAAPPEAVFEFLVDPDKILRWMGTAIDVEPEPGGRFWLNANGTDIASGTFLEVEAPHRVVFTWGWEGSTDVPPGSSTVTFTLTPEGDDTIIELRHDGLPGGATDAHGDGWGYFMGRLALVSVGEDPGRNQHAAP